MGTKGTVLVDGDGYEIYDLEDREAREFRAN